METVQVRSKAFVIRWVDCTPGSAVSWSVRPEKKSINFGVYQFEHSQIKPVEAEGGDNDTQLSERLVASGGRPEREIVRVSGGDTNEGEFTASRSVVAFVFDNTFSKNTSKTIGFSFDVAEPVAATSIRRGSFLAAPLQSSTTLSAPCLSSDQRYLSGIMMKRRRKKLQGYARRYFNLDTTRGLLNYYLDNRSSSLRGVMPVKICEIDVHNSPFIVVDSGVEKWFLKALNDQDWKTWVEALQATRNQQYDRMLSREPSLQLNDHEDAPPGKLYWTEIANALDLAKNATNDFISSGPLSETSSSFIDQLSTAFTTMENVLAIHLDNEIQPLLFAPRSGLEPPREVDEEVEQDEQDEEDDIFYDAEDDGESDLSSIDSDDDDEDDDRSSENKYADSEVSASSVPAHDALYPLPCDPVERRTTVPRCEHQPPSLLSLLRKSKDLANTSVPVTSNEPLSVLQKLAEHYEYSELLGQAAEASTSEQRVVLVAAFVVSTISQFRIKDRAMRKPFNPMLGETYELVREDKGFRFVAEKVSHRPPIFATTAESTLWTVNFTSRPYQKIWGKSAEITDTGTFHISFPSSNETVEFSMPDCFLRNLLAGEKYVEPVGTTTVESSSGAIATIEFKAGGMFSGRSEEVKIISNGTAVLEGKWTEQLCKGKDVVWKAGSLIDHPKEHYGWSVFTASLNEITAIEKDQMSPVDSRMRPDQCAYENQDVDGAEQLKQALEKRQRERRKVYEDEGRAWEPGFFHQGHNVTGNFVLKTGRANYWNRRKNQDWNGVVPVLTP